MGYKTIEQPVVLTGEKITVDLLLKEELNELKAVIITAGSFEARDEKKVSVLKPLDIVTTASANADVAAAMKTLPGTQQIGESGELFVRGGAGYETKQFIDGTTVANPNFGQAPDMASRGRFSPFLFKGTVFSTGGYSALYCRAVSTEVKFRYELLRFSTLYGSCYLLVRDIRLRLPVTRAVQDRLAGL